MIDRPLLIKVIAILAEAYPTLDHYGQYSIPDFIHKISEHMYRHGQSMNLEDVYKMIEDEANNHRVSTDTTCYAFEYYYSTLLLIELIKAKLEVQATLPPVKPIAHIDMSRGADSPVLVIRNPYDEYHDILVQFHGEVHTQAAKYVCDLINSAPRRP